MARVHEFEIESTNLAQSRKITVFLPTDDRRNTDKPVLYCADGQAVPAFAEGLCREHGRIPPVVLVGAHSSATHRAQEYIYRPGNQRFEAHERFFTDELRRWALAEFQLSAERRSTGVFGVSNGAAFALSLAVRHRETFGAVIAFSIAGGPDQVAESEYSRRPIARYYLSAGTREKPFWRTGRAIAQQLAKHGVEHCRTERCAAHDPSFWWAELPEAVRWSFSNADV